jgi:hypothetical protein
VAAVALSSLGGAGWQFFDANGNPLSGGKLYTYAAGTTTPATTYTSSSGATANANPIILDSAGRPSEQIWLDSNAAYKFTLTNSLDVPVWTKDNVPGIFADTVIEAANVEYNPPFTGALTSGYTLTDKLEQTVSVKDFGAVGDGVTDDTTAFQSALDSGQPVFIPGGTYALSSKLTSVSKPVAIYTDGGAILKWVVGSATQGFDFSFNNLTTDTLYIGDIDLTTECEGGGTAIKAAWPAGASGFSRLMTLGCIRIRGWDIPNQIGYWDYGVDTTNAWLSFCETLDFYGKVSGAYTPLSTAAWAARGNTTDCRAHMRVRYAEAGLLIAGFSEGFDISGSYFVACDYAVNCSGTSGLNTPGLVWVGGHASCFRGIVRAVNFLQGNTSDLLLYKRPDSPYNFIAFDLDEFSTEWQISDCKVFSLNNTGGGTTTGIKDAGVNNISTNMRFALCDTDVELAATASGFGHSFSRSDNLRGSIIRGSYNGQVWAYPWPALGTLTDYLDLLTVNSATPSVLGCRQWSPGSGYIYTQNSSPTSITDLTEWFPGQEFVLEAGDANTTLVNSASFLLIGGVNLAMTSGQTVRMRRVNSTTWKQVA